MQFIQLHQKKKKNVAVSPRKRKISDENWKKGRKNKVFFSFFSLLVLFFEEWKVFSFLVFLNRDEIRMIIKCNSVLQFRAHDSFPYYKLR